MMIQLKGERLFSFELAKLKPGDRSDVSMAHSLAQRARFFWRLNQRFSLRPSFLGHGASSLDLNGSAYHTPRGSARVWSLGRSGGTVDTAFQTPWTSQRHSWKGSSIRFLRCSVGGWRRKVPMASACCIGHIRSISTLPQLTPPASVPRPALAERARWSMARH